MTAGPPQPYTSWGASRSQIDKAGDLLREFWREQALIAADVDEALELAWRFRSEFQTPLTKVVMGLRSFLRTEGAEVVVGQRLKRMPTILDKLTRYPAMKLTRMQDIGGCRALLPAGGYEISCGTIGAQMAVVHFLLVYDHRLGRLVGQQEFADADKAVAAYAEMEAQHRGDRNLEIVLVGADSIETIMRTHAHYFEAVADPFRDLALTR